MARSSGYQADPQLDEQLARLLLAAANGDVAAFEAFYTRTVSEVLKPVRRICGSSLAEDALADAYIQAWTCVASFDAKRGSAVAWITMIATSRARDRIRAERACHGGVLELCAHDEAADRPDPAQGPEDILQTAQAVTHLRDAVSALPARQRMVIGLAYYRDCTHRQISEAMDIPVGTVKNLIRDSHARLTAMLPAGAAGAWRHG